MTPRRNNSRRVKEPFSTPKWKVIGALIYMCALIGNFYLAVLIVDRNPPVRFISREAVQSSVPRGGVLQTHFSLERYRFCDAEIDRWVIDSTGEKHSISSYTAAIFPKLGLINDSREITLPPNVAVGPAEYIIDAKYYCNWIQILFNAPIIVKSPAVRFNVT